MKININTKRVLWLTTIACLIMVITSINGLLAMAAATVNWTPTTTGVQLASVSQQGATASVKTSDGYYIVLWAGYTTDWDIYGQKLNTSGEKQWGTDGISLVTGTGDQPSASIYAVADNQGGAIFAYADTNQSDALIVKKVDSAGTISWTAGPFSQSVDDVSLIPDGSGGAYIAYEQAAANTNVYALHITTAGSANWNSGSPVSIDVSAYDEKLPRATIASDGLIITYLRQAGTTRTIRSVKLQTNGSLDTDWTFGADQFISATTDQTDLITAIDVTTDGSDGVIIAFDLNDDIKAQRVNTNPLTAQVEALWSSDGISVCNAANYQNDPLIISDNNHGAIITWSDGRGSVPELYAQRVNSSGSTIWAANGVIVSTDGLTKYQHKIASNGGNGAIITFISAEMSGPTPVRSDIKAQLLNSSGVKQWGAGGTDVETDTGTIFDVLPILSGNNNGGGLVTWLRQASYGGASTIHSQYISDESSGVCMDVGSSSFCGTQIISPYTLTFTQIPDSFKYANITSGHISYNCNNGSNLAAPSNICSSALTEKPGSNDTLKVFDNRNTGGFTVNVSVAGNFTDGTNFIPLTNLYLLTTLPETAPPGTTNISGINYEGTGDTTINAPAYVNEFAPAYVDISNPSSYTSRAQDTQFGGDPLVLMNGTLPESSGRSGYFSQYVTFYLKVDSTQAPGNYALILTYDLIDSTTT